MVEIIKINIKLHVLIFLRPIILKTSEEEPERIKR